MLHDFAERNGLNPYIISTNPLYATTTGEDWLGNYFDGRRMIGNYRPLRGWALDSTLRFVVSSHIDLNRASMLFNRYFVRNSLIAGHIKRIVGARPGGMFDLSIHFRATDKAHESGRVVGTDIIWRLETMQREEHPPSDIFLATDDTLFEQTLRARFSNCTFTTFNLGKVEPGVARHFSKLRPLDKAVEALVNIFLLAAAPRSRTSLP